MYGTDVDKILEKLWDTSGGHLAASLIQHTECTRVICKVHICFLFRAPDADVTANTQCAHRSVFDDY